KNPARVAAKFGRLGRDDHRRAEPEKWTEACERPFGHAYASGRDAAPDRPGFVRPVDRQLVASGPARGKPWLDAAYPEREGPERAPAEGHTIRDDVLAGRCG